ncbi:MAG: hypothetical protein ACI9TF_001774, partial [Paracrocinitomix sp.]
DLDAELHHKSRHRQPEQQDHDAAAGLVAATSV